MTCKNRPRYDL